MVLLKNKKFDFNLFFKNALKCLLLVFISVSMILSFVNVIKSYREEKNTIHEEVNLTRFDKGIKSSNNYVGTPVPNTGTLTGLYINTSLTHSEVLNIITNANLDFNNEMGLYIVLATASNLQEAIAIQYISSTNSYVISFGSGSGNGNFPLYSSTDSTSWNEFSLDIPFNTNFLDMFPYLSNSLLSTFEAGLNLSVGLQNSSLSQLFSTTPFIEVPNEPLIDISNQTWLFAKDTFINNVDLVKPFLCVSSDDRNLYYDKAYFSFNDTYSLGNLSSSSVWGYDLMGFTSDTGFTVFYDNKELELYNSATNKVIDSMYNYYVTFAPNTYVWYGAFDDMPNNSEDSFYIAFLDIQEDFEPSLEIFEYLTSNIFRVYDSLTTDAESSIRTYNYNDSEVPNFIFDFTFGSNGQTFFGVNRFNNNLSYKLIDGSYLQVMSNNVWIDYAYQVITYDTQNVSFYTEDALYKTFGLSGNQRQYRISGWYTFNLVPDVSSIFDSSGFWYYEKPFLSNNTSYSGFSIEYYTDSLITRIRYLNSASGTYELVYDSNGWVSDNYRYLFLGNVIVSSNTYFDLLSTGLYGYISTNSFDTTIPDLFFTIADVPIYTLSQLLSFELFGTQLFVAFSSIITLILVVYVIRKLI